jgi:exodeoxyribonuclease VII large subunit
MASEPLVLAVSEFVAYANQTLEYAYPSVIIEGELANFRVSKNKWVYFDLKDEAANLRFFGTVYMLKGPMEDGMMLKVRAVPRLHPQYGFSMTIQQIELVGEGTIKQAAKLLQEKLAKEGLFDAERKRTLPYPPKRIGLITSMESAAYADFIKIIAARWGELDIQVADIQVQGMDAPAQLIQAVNDFNQHSEPPDVLVMIRGGGSPEDLQAFSDEHVVRAVAGSRIPMLVAIGHEIDVSLAELAADQRASTPSNAAELLVPDKAHIHTVLQTTQQTITNLLQAIFDKHTQQIVQKRKDLQQLVESSLERVHFSLAKNSELLKAFDPSHALTRGYAVIRKNTETLKQGAGLRPGDIVDIQMQDVDISAEVKRVTKRKRT